MLLVYNSQTFEYRQIEASDYSLYRENANYLLSLISDWANISLSEITYEEVIDFFIEKFDIEIVYFDKKEDWFYNHSPYVHEHQIEVTKTFVKRVSGFTITNGKTFKIFLQNFTNRQRIIYTLLHELVHIFFHCTNDNYMQIFASMEVDGHYPKEIIPFEDEANVIASFLYLNETKLIEYLDEGCSFDMILSRHNISRRALHNRLNNYLIYSLELNPQVALNNFLLPYKKEVFGSEAIDRIQFVRAYPKKILQFIRTEVP